LRRRLARDCLAACDRVATARRDVLFEVGWDDDRGCAFVEGQRDGETVVQVWIDPGTCRNHIVRFIAHEMGMELREGRLVKRPA
jgi:hypothetical protein